MVRSWCDRLHSWYGVDAIWHVAGVIPQSHPMWFLCTLYSVLYTAHSRNSFGRFLKTKYKEIHQISYIITQLWLMTWKTGAILSKSTKVTLRSWCDLVKWPYGVKKIRIKWLCPVKVTLEVIKRHLKVFCWSCDEGHLKLDKKNNRASQFIITDQMSLLSPLNSNGQSIPLNK